MLIIDKSTVSLRCGQVQTKVKVSSGKPRQDRARVKEKLMRYVILIKVMNVKDKGGTVPEV